MKLLRRRRKLRMLSKDNANRKKNERPIKFQRKSTSRHLHASGKALEAQNGFILHLSFDGYTFTAAASPAVLSARRARVQICGAEFAFTRGYHAADVSKSHACRDLDLLRDHSRVWRKQSN
jgi:hypothetical protein